MPHQVLTKRQHQVLALMLELKTHYQIATEMGVATLTIRNHIIQIWDRLCQPRNREYALSLLHSLYEGHIPGVAHVVAFGRLQIGQQFQYQGQLYEKVDRVRDRLGTYNAATLAGKRLLFPHHILVEVVTDE